MQQYGQAPSPYGQPPPPGMAPNPMYGAQAQAQIPAPPQGHAYGTPPPGGYNPYQQPQGYVPPVHAAAPAENVWRWHYSRFIGICYGPIPVGLIVAVIILGAYYGTRF